MPESQTALADLLGKIESAEGPDREIDAAIAALFDVPSNASRVEEWRLKRDDEEGDLIEGREPAGMYWAWGLSPSSDLTSMQN